MQEILRCTEQLEENYLFQVVLGSVLQLETLEQLQSLRELETIVVNT